MPRSWSFSSAYTPPRRTLQSSSFMAAGSRVDALFELQTCATFIDDPVLCDTDECGVEDTMATSRGAWTENEKASFHPCRSCHETHRLRNALKRIEGEYVAEIESLRVQLDEAAAQRAAAVRERNSLLASADAGATQLLEMERAVTSLELTVVKLSQEKEKLQLRVQELEKEGAAAREKHTRAARIVLEDTEAAERAHVEAAEKEQGLFLRQLCLAESARVAAIAQVIYVNTLKRRAAAAGGVAADKRGSCCTSVLSGCTPEVSSRGLSEESRERRTSSPRPSQRRSMTAANTQRLADSPRSPRGRGGGEGAAATPRCTHLVDPAQTGARAAAGVHLAMEKIKRLEWNLEQQRSAYEMQLAEERALTSEMQAEVDDLIESELVLLEANGRVVVERDWAEAIGDAVRYLLQSHRVALRSRQATSNEALMVDVTLSEASSVTSPRASNGESGKRHLSAMTKQLSVAAEGFVVEPVVCEALLPDVLAGVEETRRGVHILHDSVTRCHAAVESTRTEQERMKALLHRLLAEMAMQRCRAEETQSTLGPIAHISAHSGDARFLSEGHEEVTVKATTPATAVAQSGVDNKQPKGANSNLDLDPPRRWHTEAQRSSSAGDVTFLAHTDHISAAYVSDAFSSRPSDMRLLEGGEGGYSIHTAFA
ncbi:hypothetical protein LSCM4_04369 [Leishmania orientalis]|uniref:Uncharacterized protein n=1 Tax=Leishmania orientalis TaxID=2249476 RepID=A0A836H0E5_9TRYP|nr:hypothetical protein LSCM4_04369 [Leishmania orientalis]